MLNSLHFSERLEKIMKFHGLSASGFADKIGVQRSSISHILSGRNKPSLDFIMKVLSSFENVDLYWLLIGKGNFPIDSNETQEINIKPESKPLISKLDVDKKEIDRVVIFFKDGSFKNYSN
jgi:transcriptional regulator with XRE-family HTH domain